MAPNTQIIVPVALGLSLVTVTAFVVYYVFKKNDDDETHDKTIRTSRVNVIEVNVPKSIVPALIGRGGVNIKEIEKKTGALIHFKKFTDKEYDVCIIRGRSQATQLAEMLVHEFIKQQPNIIEDHIEVPNWSCGRIIGTGGETINDISHRSGARVKIESPANDNSTQRHVTFRGTREQIDVAKELVQNCVAQETCRREIQSSKLTRHASPAPSTPPAVPATPPVAPAPPSPVPAENVDATDGTQENSGASIEVYVSAVSSPQRFWVQFVGPQVSQLDELVQHMTEYYGNKENRAQHKLKQVHVGQVVAAVFRHDGRWYRARVHDIRPNEFDATQQVADVFYLDYGDSEYVATHELCELRADLLRLRFQAMECFLAGVRPSGNQTRWDPQAIERFEELAQVARWKPLVSRTCTYKKISTGEAEKTKEIPGIKLFDVTEDGEVDIGATLVAEGWGVEVTAVSPRASPPRPAVSPSMPFGDLTHSRVLGMLAGGTRASSMPKDHKDDRVETKVDNDCNDDDRVTSSKSLSSGLEKSDEILSITNFDTAYPDLSKTAPYLNGTRDNFLDNERQHVDREGSTDTLIPTTNLKSSKDDLKANINRIDSHHGNLASLDSK